MSAKPKRKPGQCQCEDTGCPCRGNCSVRRVKLVKNSLDGDWLACARCRRYRGIEPQRKPRKVRRVVLGVGRLFMTSINYTAERPGGAYVLTGVQSERGIRKGLHHEAEQGQRGRLVFEFDPPKAKR